MSKWKRKEVADTENKLVVAEGGGWVRSVWVGRGQTASEGRA